MTKITNLEMGRALSKDHRIAIRRSCFGFISRTVFTPTESPLEAYRFEYPADKGEQIERLLTAPEDQLKQRINTVKTLRSDSIGNTRLEVCLSVDRQFAAAQLFRYSDFLPTPVTPLVTYEGEAAQAIASLL